MGCKPHHGMPQNIILGIKSLNKVLAMTRSETGLVHLIIWDLICQMAKFKVWWLIISLAAEYSCLCPTLIQSSSPWCTVTNPKGPLGSSNTQLFWVRKAAGASAELHWERKSLTCKLGWSVAWGFHRLQFFFLFVSRPSVDVKPDYIHSWHLLTESVNGFICQCALQDEVTNCSGQRVLFINFISTIQTQSMMGLRLTHA